MNECWSYVNPTISMTTKGVVNPRPVLGRWRAAKTYHKREAVLKVTWCKPNPLGMESSILRAVNNVFTGWAQKSEKNRMGETSVKLSV